MSCLEIQVFASVKNIIFASKYLIVLLISIKV